MDSRKYVKDYIIEEEYDPVRKKLRSKAVYAGKYFGFVHADRIRTIRILFLGLSALSFLAYAGILVINAPCSHNWYTMVPLAVMMLPLIFLAASDLRLITAKDRVTREHKDKITARFRVVSLIQSVLAGLALVGHVVYSILVGDTLTDLAYYALTLILLGASAVMFARRSLLDMTVVGYGEGYEMPDEAAEAPGSDGTEEKASAETAEEEKTAETAEEESSAESGSADPE